MKNKRKYKEFEKFNPKIQVTYQGKTEAILRSRFIKYIVENTEKSLNEDFEIKDIYGHSLKISLRAYIG